MWRLKAILPAMYKYRSPGEVVLNLHSPVKGQQGCSKLWYSMIRPGSVLKLCHLVRMLVTKLLCSNVHFPNNTAVGKCLVYRD